MSDEESKKPPKEAPSARASRVANAVLVAAAIIAALNVVFAIQLKRPTLLVSIPALAAAALLGALALKRSWKVTAAPLVVSLFFALYAAEGYLGVARPRPATAAHRAGRGYDTRSVREVLADMRKTGVEVYPNFNLRSLFEVRRRESKEIHSGMSIGGRELMPLGGVSNRTTLYAVESGEYVVDMSDEHGFENPKGIWGAEKIDVAFVGDSYTQGSNVPVPKNATAPIREIHPRSLNVAKPGNGPLVELATVQEYLTALKPRITLWCYYYNDLADLNTEKASPLLMRYLDEDFKQGLVDQQPEIDRQLIAFIDAQEADVPIWPAGLASVGLTRQSTPDWLQDLVMGTALSSTAAVMRFDSLSASTSSRTSHGAPPDFPLLKRILAKAKDLVASWGGDFYFVYLPDSWYLNGKSSGAHPARKTMLDMAGELGIPIIDVHAVFATHPDPSSLRFYLESHWNEAGYRLMGEVMRDALKKRYPDF